MIFSRSRAWTVGGERALVHHQHGLAERGAHLSRALACEPALGNAGVAGEESLQRLGFDPGFRLPASSTPEARGRGHHAVAVLCARTRRGSSMVGLTGARIALYAHDPIPRRQDSA